MEKSKKLIGAGIALAAVGAAASYFLAGKRGKENREQIAAWTLKMKGEVLEQMKKLKEIDKDKYYAMVDDVAKRYKRVGRVSAGELEHLTEEVKNAWAHISKQLK